MTLPPKVFYARRGFCHLLERDHESHSWIVGVWLVSSHEWVWKVLSRSWQHWSSASECQDSWTWLQSVGAAAKRQNMLSKSNTSSSEARTSDEMHWAHPLDKGLRTKDCSCIWGMESSICGNLLEMTNFDTKASYQEIILQKNYWKVTQRKFLLNALLWGIVTFEQSIPTTHLALQRTER